MLRFPATIRKRLTLWYTIILGAPLVVFAAVSWFELRYTLSSRTDEFMDQALEAFERELRVEQLEHPRPIDAIHAGLNEMRFTGSQFFVLDPSWSVVAEGEAATGVVGRGANGKGGDSEGDYPEVDRAELLARLRERPGSAMRVFTVGRDDGGYRVHTRPVTLAGIQFSAVIIHSLHDMDATLERFAGINLFGIPLLLVTASAGGYFLAKRSLSPVGAMGARAAEISATTLGERLPVVTPGDELGVLGTVINSLLDRLERSFSQQRRFMADASHELRTPVAILRTEADVTLARDQRSESEYRSAMGIVQSASDRLSRIVDDLFLLARVDVESVSPQFRVVQLQEVVHDATRSVHGLAEQRGVTLTLGQVVDAPVRGDPDLLHRLFLNLLDNAIKFTPAGGRVTIDLSAQAGGRQYVVNVIDTGPGIPVEAQKRVFERFFRVDPARSRTEVSGTSGAGLGLSIALWVAETHGGTLEVVESKPGRTVFRVQLPALSAQASSAA